MSDAPKFGFWPLVLPFLAFMAIGLFEPRFGQLAEADHSSAGSTSASRQSSAELHPWVAGQVKKYLFVYAAKIAAVVLILLFFFKFYMREFPFTVTPLAGMVGVIGCILWIGICTLGIESSVMGWLGSGELSARSAFNPFELITQQWQQVCFLLLRFLGLALIVPICEELFLRGFLLRIVEHPNWWRVRLAEISTKTLLVAPIYGALTHPAELLAAIVWFSLINWLMKRTGKFWDCVLAHAVTNLLLGIYVVTFSQWQLW